ncbi:MAG TPA: hypothetical protein VNJ07_00090 [Chitinophagales bacterium]|nr:hypothetical protein [Chitinophagales bacterium]
MKKLIIMSWVSLMLTPVFAQFEKGNIIAGGALCFQRTGSRTVNGSTVKGPTDVGFRFMPHVGYFFADNTTIGGFLDFDLSTTITYQDDVNGDEIKLKDKDNFIGIGPELYHFRLIGEKKWFGIYGYAAFAFGTGGGKYETYNFLNDEIVSTDKNRSMQLYVGAAPGMVFMPQDWFFFDIRFDGFGLWYNYEVEKQEGTDIKNKQSYLKIGGSLNELFLTDTKVGAHFVF